MLFAHPLFKAARSPGRTLTVRNFSISSVRNRQRVVILGSGWGGYNILRRIDKKRWGMYLICHLKAPFVICVSSDVTILSPNTYFNFTPLLAGTAVGTLEFRCAVESVRRYTPQVVRSAQSFTKTTTKH
jgi:NADH dehydrogenase FAD-containing subunit